MISIELEKQQEPTPNGPWILTRLGKQIFLQHPRVEDVDLRDIAFALSRINRFTGHCSPTWSVGQHSLYCCEMALLSYRPASIQLLALAHDFPEAYLGDVSSPLKACISGYRELETLHRFAIEEALDLPAMLTQDEQSVKAIDSRAYAVDRWLCMPTGPSWSLPVGDRPSLDEAYVWGRIANMSPDNVADSIVWKFAQLKGKL